MANVTVPTLEEKLDNMFLSTWYKIKPEAVDNILEASVVMTLMKEKGMLEKQVGGRLLTETIRYDVSSSKWVKKGSTLPQGEKETETMGIWNWHYLAGHVQRSRIDDQQNSGPDKIKDYVKSRIMDARDGMSQDLEKYLFYGSEDLSSFFDTDTGTLVPEEIEIEGHDGPVMQGLNTLVPPPDYANKRLVTDGTFGRIKRCSAYTTNSVGCYVPDKANATNAFWGPRYGILRKPYAVYLVEDMNRLFDTIFNNQVAPDIILSTLELFEVYKDMALDVTQIVKDTKTRAADLGYEVLLFRGKPFTWSPNVDTYQTSGGTRNNHVLMINSQYAKLKYDPNMWFDMGKFKDIPLQGERIAHIMSAITMTSNQLRRHGRLSDDWT